MRKAKPLFNKDSSFTVLSKIRAIDIDNIEDVKLAEVLMLNKIK